MRASRGSDADEPVLLGVICQDTVVKDEQADRRCHELYDVEPVAQVPEYGKQIKIERSPKSCRMNMSKYALNYAMFSLRGSILGMTGKAGKIMVDITGIKKRPKSLDM